MTINHCYSCHFIKYFPITLVHDGSIVLLTNNTVKRHDIIMHTTEEGRHIWKVYETSRYICQVDISNACVYLCIEFWVTINFHWLTFAVMVQRVVTMLPNFPSCCTCTNVYTLNIYIYININVPHYSSIEYHYALSNVYLYIRQLQLNIMNLSFAIRIPNHFRTHIIYSHDDY